MKSLSIYTLKVKVKCLWYLIKLCHFSIEIHIPKMLSTSLLITYTCVYRVLDNSLCTYKVTNSVKLSCILLFQFASVLTLKKYFLLHNRHWSIKLNGKNVRKIAVKFFLLIADLTLLLLWDFLPGFLPYHLRTMRNFKSEILGNIRNKILYRFV